MEAGLLGDLTKGRAVGIAPLHVPRDRSPETAIGAHLSAPPQEENLSSMPKKAGDDRSVDQHGSLSSYHQEVRFYTHPSRGARLGV
jgi:hypothetical protein